jgi:hypothetical protein
MRTKTLIILTACTVAACCTAQLASARPSATLIQLKLPHTTSTYVDLGRKGYSAGDYFLSSGRLLDAATSKPAGRLGGIWTILSRQADHVTIDLGLDSGTLFVTGQIRHTAPRSALTIAGGTGRYSSARGTVVFRYTSQTTAALDVYARR